MKIIFATHNEGKVKEIKEIFAGLPVEVVSAEEAGIHEDPIEDGKTFEENAAKKVKFVAEKLKEKEWVLADDSGICIAALHGAPGVRSARWAGEGASGVQIAAYTLEKMKDVPEDKRSAYFQCAMVLLSPEGESFSFFGRVDGTITMEPHGEAHPKLPYDAIFIPKDQQKAFTELSPELKNLISHRGRAMQFVKEFLVQRGLAV